MLHVQEASGLLWNDIPNHNGREISLIARITSFSACARIFHAVSIEQILCQQQVDKEQL